MHRLFTAIRPPAEIRAQLLEIMGGVMAARWQSDEQLHLTLRFIGAVDARVAEDLALALGSVRFPTVKVKIDGLGVFERKGRAETLWAGVSGADDLIALHRKIEHALVRAGLQPEGRAYKPHITLARFGRRGGEVSAFVAEHGGLSLPPFQATAFHLFESHTHSEGADYTIVESYRLGR